jgi:hypothetical protein
MTGTGSALAGRLAQDWTLSAVVTLQTGTPLIVKLSSADRAWVDRA